MPITVNRRQLLKAGAASAAVGLGATLSACSGSSSAASGSSKSLQLLLLGPDQTTIAWVKGTLLPAFTKSSGIDVTLQTSDWGSAFQKVTTGAASNSLADVFLIGGIWNAPLASKDVMLDITDRVKNWSGSQQIYPSMLVDGVYKGANYSIPVYADVRTNIGRTDLLEKAGISGIPHTWAEWTTAAQAMKAKGVKSPIYFGLDKSIGLQQRFAHLMLSAGGTYWDASGKPQFGSEAGQKALQYMVDAFQHGLSDYNVVWSGNGPLPPVLGLSGLALDGAALPRNAEVNDKSVLPLLGAGHGIQMNSSSQPTALAFVNKLAIAKNTKNPDGAFELIKFICSKQYGGDFARYYGGMPVRKDLADAAWLAGIYKDIAATATNAVSQPSNPVMMSLGPAVNQLLEPAIRGSVSVTATLAAIDAKVASLGA